MEIKPNRVKSSLKLLRRHTAYQRKVLATTMEPRVSWKYLAKMWKNSEMSSAFAAILMGAAYWLKHYALCFTCLFIACRVFIRGLSVGKNPPPTKKKIKLKLLQYAKIEFLSISGVIFSPASGGFAPRPHRALPMVPICLYCLNCTIFG